MEIFTVSMIIDFPKLNNSMFIIVFRLYKASAVQVHFLPLLSLLNQILGNVYAIVLSYLLLLGFLLLFCLVFNSKSTAASMITH